METPNNRFSQCLHPSPPQQCALSSVRIRVRVSVGVRVSVSVRVSTRVKIGFTVRVKVVVRVRIGLGLLRQCVVG